MIFPVEHVTISIQRPPAEVYSFASNAKNLPQWAAGLSGAKIDQEGSHWISDSPMGKVKIKFAERNSLGVMDHDVTVPSGDTTHNAFRVVPNGGGSEVIFTLVKAKGVTDAEFAKDAAQIRTDLKKLKSIVEK